MADRNEERDLAEADLHIAEIEAQIARQHELAAAMRATGGHEAASENLLAITKQSLAEIREHRRLILASLDQEI